MSATGSLLHSTPQEVIDTLVDCPSPRAGDLRNGDLRNQLDLTPFHSYCDFRWSLYHIYNGRNIATQSCVEHQSIIGHLRRGLTRAEITSEMRAEMQKQHLEDDDVSLATSLYLLAELTVMLRIGAVPGEISFSCPISWDDRDSSLQDIVSRQFASQPALTSERFAFPRMFDAWSVEAIGGIEIVLTDNLAEHLELLEDIYGVKLFVFHHASYLEWQDDTFYPHGLLEETLRTLALLFPEREFLVGGHQRKKRWFTSLKERNMRSRSPKLVVDARLGCCGNVTPLERRIETFHFWRDRLVILKQAYDEATPQSVSQWWYDRRNGVQWHTFWVAILVLLITTGLSTIQCIEGALQVYKAFNEL